jgi:hypothetical protein
VNSTDIYVGGEKCKMNSRGNSLIAITKKRMSKKSKKCEIFKKYKKLNN